MNFPRLLNQTLLLLSGEKLPELQEMVKQLEKFTETLSRQLKADFVE
jgi:hypothetical protein